MIYVVDTHPLVWHLENNPKLSVPAAAVLGSSQAALVIPSIVIAEVWYLYQKKRIAVSADEVRRRVLSSSNCSVYPLDEAVLQQLPHGLDIHDAVIAATALVYRDLLRQPVRLITADKTLTQAGLMEVLWWESPQ